MLIGLLRNLLHLALISCQLRRPSCTDSKRREVLARPLHGMEFLAAGPGKLGTGEDSIKGVIILLRHRIEFVVMASGTAERQSHERTAGRLDRVFQGQMPKFVRRGGVTP